MTRFTFQGVTGKISPMPGSTIAISYNVYSSNPGLGNGTRANAARLARMKMLGYEYAICTVDHTNHAQRRIMQKNGWQQLSNFHSEKTEHNVILYGQPL